MKKVILNLISWLTLFVSYSGFSAEKAELIYEDYFGDYFVGSRHPVEIDLDRDTPATVYSMLLEKAKRANANLLLIGYGPLDSVGAYALGTHHFASNEDPFSKIESFKKLDHSRKDGRFFFRFVNPHFSRYADPLSPVHHFASPFKHLNFIGRRVTFF